MSDPKSSSNSCSSNSGSANYVTASSGSDGSSNSSNQSSDVSSTATDATKRQMAKPTAGTGSTRGGAFELQPENLLINKEEICLEVTVSAPSLAGTDSNQLSAQGVRVPCSMKAAQVSPVLARVISKFMPPDDACQHSTHNNNSSVPINGRVDNGKLVLSLVGSLACNHVTVARVVEWMNYHILDEEFEKNCRFEYFDQDEYEKEQQRLSELPCYFDWRYITEVGGGETLSDHRRAYFYDLVVLADYLGLEPLVLLCGKYICATIKGKPVKDVRKILGLANDLTKEEEKRILKANEAILCSKWEKR